MIEVLLLIVVAALVSIVYGMTQQHKELIREIRGLRKQIEITFTKELMNGR